MTLSKLFIHIPLSPSEIIWYLVIFCGSEVDLVSHWLCVTNNVNLLAGSVA